MDANTMKAQLIARLRSSNYDILNIDDREASDVLSRAQLEFVLRRTVPDLNVKKKGFEIDGKRRLDLSNLIASTVSLKRIKEGEPGDFILGTEDNGALRTPDKDYQVEGNLPSSNDYVSSDYGVFVRIPDECLFIIQENCKTSRGNAIKHNVPVQTVTYEEYITGIHHPYLSPYYNKVWRLDSGNWNPSVSELQPSTKYLTGQNADGNSGTTTIQTERSVMLIPGKDWTIEAYNIHYIKKPRRIVVDVISPNNQQNCELGSAVHDEIVDTAVRLFISDRMPEQSKYQVAEKEQREDE